MLQQIITWINDYLQRHDSLLVAVDGRCASGKTTLASRLQQYYGEDCQVFHMDDFFLRPEQRTPQRLAMPGENVDHERFLEEVLEPWVAGKPVSYRPYDCSTQSLAEPFCAVPGKVLVVEGSYSCHRLLRDYYDLHIFLDVDAKTQMERILARNGEEAAKVFAERWIPLEEAYFSAQEVKAHCELYFSVDK